MSAIKKKDHLKVGVKINSVEILERAEDFEGESDLRPAWVVLCDCGKEKIKTNRDIRRSKSCGHDCLLKKNPGSKKIYN